MSVKTVDVATAKQWLDDNNAEIVDVREPKEYAAEKIAEATLHPLGTITANDLPKTDKKIIIQCQKGGRSMKACEKLLAEDSSLDIYNLTGGIEAWAKAGLPTEKDKK